MTGKDVILYILQNNLENEEVLNPGTSILVIGEVDLAAYNEVGIATVHTWFDQGDFEGFKIGDVVFNVLPVDLKKNK